MENNVSRILIETIVKKTLKEIKDSPERSVRNLVDLALHVSTGRFQHRFFEAAQTMLKNETSPYYALIRDTVAHVEAAHLAGFGMNLGYNGCTVGAETIRAAEEARGFNIPWSVSLCIDGEQFPRYREHYYRAIRQGESLGAYTWLLFVDGPPHEILALPEGHCDSAFILYGVRREVYDYVQRARNEQLFQTLPWEAAFDGSFVDSIISQDACSVGFDEDGHLMTLYEKKPQESLNLFQNDLPLILQRAFPKKHGCHRDVETAGAARGHSFP